MTDTTATHPGYVEIDDSGPEPRVRFTPPQEWFTLPELRRFAEYLTLLADENEPSPEVDALARALETASLVGSTHRATARNLLAAGYRLERDVTP